MEIVTCEAVVKAKTTFQIFASHWDSNSNPAQ